MRTKIRSVKGEVQKNLDLPPQFNEEIRPDLIKRAFLAIQSHKRQQYGAKPMAGKRPSAKLSRRRRDYKGAYGIGISRVPRKSLNNRGTRFYWVGAFSPNTVGGRRAHPPKSEKIWEQKINKKERRKAIRSALAASVQKDFVEKRGHIIKDYPLIIENSIEEVSKTSDVIEILKKMGLAKELERISERKIRAGRAKTRGRKYKVKTGPLIVVSKKCSVIKAAENIPGVNCVTVTQLNAENLAPGAQCGRLTIYTEAVIERIRNEYLYTDNPKIKKSEQIKDEKTNASKIKTTNKKPKKPKSKSSEKKKSAPKKKGTKEEKIE